MSAKLAGDRSLRTDYMMVGTLSLGEEGVNAQQLPQGEECDRATHVVSTIYVGGFALAAGAADEIEAGGSVFGIGAGAAASAPREQLIEEGSPDACRAAQSDGEGKEPTLCHAPLRVNLRPIVGREHLSGQDVAAGKPASASGFEGTCPAGMAKIPSGSFLFYENEVIAAAF